MKTLARLTGRFAPTLIALLACWCPTMAGCSATREGGDQTKEHAGAVSQCADGDEDFDYYCEVCNNDNDCIACIASQGDMQSPGCATYCGATAHDSVPCTMYRPYSDFCQNNPTTPQCGGSGNGAAASGSGGTGGSGAADGSGGSDDGSGAADDGSGAADDGSGDPDDGSGDPDDGGDPDDCPDCF